MSYIDWSDEFNTEILEIDIQHKIFVNMLNDFHYAIECKVSHEGMENLLKGLAEYAATHFKTEEEYMFDNGYPDLNGHVNEHNKFVEQFNILFLNYKNDNEVDVMLVLEFMKSWLHKHLLGTDQKYVEYFKENPIK